MSQLFVVKPTSREVNWLLSLRINNQRNRVTSCLHKIDRLFRQSRQGNIVSILEAYEKSNLFITNTLQVWDQGFARSTTLRQTCMVSNF